MCRCSGRRRAASGPGMVAVLLCVLSLVAQLPTGARKLGPASPGGWRAGVVGGRVLGKVSRGLGQLVAGGAGGFQMLTDLTYMVPEQLPGVSFSSARSRRRYMVCWGMCAVVVSASWLS